MSSARFHWPGHLTTIALLVVTLPVVVHAQEKQRDERTLDSIQTAIARLSSAIRLEERKKIALPKDTLHVGPLTVITSPGLRPLAERAARDVLDSMTDLAGKGVASLYKYTLVLGVGSRPSWAHSNPDGSVAEASILDTTGRLMLLRTVSLDAGDLARAWQSAESEMLQRAVPADFRRWVGAQIPIQRFDSETWTSMRLTAIQNPVRITRRCLAADMDACAIALGLTSVADTLAQFYDSSDRVRFAKLVVAAANEYDRAPARHDLLQCQGLSGGAAAGCARVLKVDLAREERRVDSIRVMATRCIDTRGHATSCDALMITPPFFYITKLPPLSVVVRGSLVREAMILGGPGAYERLIASHGTLAERIEAIAGMPLDTVLRSWYQMVMTANRTTKSIDATTIVSSLAWTIMCCTLALRSSRWR